MKIRMKNPYLCKNILMSFDPGNNAKRIWEPSKGGTGIRLKIARSKFIQTMYAKTVPTP